MSQQSSAFDQRSLDGRLGSCRGRRRPTVGLESLGYARGAAIIQALSSKGSRAAALVDPTRVMGFGLAAAAIPIAFAIHSAGSRVRESGVGNRRQELSRVGPLPGRTRECPWAALR